MYSYVRMVNDAHTHVRNPGLSCPELTNGGSMAKTSGHPLTTTNVVRMTTVTFFFFADPSAMRQSTDMILSTEQLLRQNFRNCISKNHGIRPTTDLQ